MTEKLNMPATELAVSIYGRGKNLAINDAYLDTRFTPTERDAT